MTDRLKIFSEGLDEIDSLDASTREDGIYSPDLRKSQDAREYLEKTLLENLRLPAPDYNNRKQVLERVDLAHNFERDRTQGYFGQNIDTILGEISPEGLARVAVSTNPAGEDTRAKAHKRAKKWGTLRLVYKQNENYDAIVEDIASEIEDELDDRFDESANPRNAGLSKDRKKVYKRAVTSVVKRDEGTGIRILKRIDAEASQKFEDTFDENNRERDMANYATLRITKQFRRPHDKKRDNQMEAMRLTYVAGAEDLKSAA